MEIRPPDAGRPLAGHLVLTTHLRPDGDVISKTVTILNTDVGSRTLDRLVEERPAGSAQQAESGNTSGNAEQAARQPKPTLGRSCDVPAPVPVRYAWADNPARATLTNADRLPAGPFRAGPDLPRFLLSRCVRSSFL